MSAYKEISRKSRTARIYNPDGEGYVDVDLMQSVTYQTDEGVHTMKFHDARTKKQKRKDKRRQQKAEIKYLRARVDALEREFCS